MSDTCWLHYKNELWKNCHLSSLFPRLSIFLVYHSTTFGMDITTIVKYIEFVPHRFGFREHGHLLNISPWDSYLGVFWLGHHQNGLSNSHVMTVMWDCLWRVYACLLLTKLRCCYSWHSTLNLATQTESPRNVFVRNWKLSKWKSG